MADLRDVTIVKANALHAEFFPQCVALVDRTQGAGIFRSEYFQQCLSNPLFLLLLALRDNELIGIATARVLAAEGAGFYSPFGPAAADLFRRHQVGSLESASVTEPWQGCGIGTELARRRLEWLQERGCSAVVGITWESGGRTSDHVFRRLGLDRICRVEKFYVELSQTRGFTCPICGPPPCHCAGTLYAKVFRTISNPEDRP